ncbi:MAG: hypothetical protein ABIR25_00790 [Sphingomicrobium sp.]
MAGLMLIVLPSLAGAQAIIVSPKPDKVAVTVYRDPYGSGAMELSWLGGFALITETRRVSLPAGEVDLRFEGVAGGLIPQSAVVSGLGDAVSEKNRDAKLLSPGTLIDAYLGQRVHLRRTSKETGKVTEQNAIVRASGDGIVVQTETGIEALRCTGQSETLLAPGVPAELSAKPTLSVRARSDRPVEADVTLTYLTSNFDWRAHYVATLAPDGKTLSLFAWLTLANGDDTGFANADTMAVAGRLNREYAARLQPETRPIALNCWPSGTTSDSDDDEANDSPYPPPLPPPPPPAATAERGESIVVTGSRIMAQREDLGDLKLYRIPIPVTVASRSQKQVALLERPSAKVTDMFRWNSSFANDSGESQPAQRLLKMDNRQANGLGLPLPAGSFTLFTMRDGQPFLLGEGRMTDRAVGEMVEVALADAPGVRVMQAQADRPGKDQAATVTVSNDQSETVRFEARFGDDGKLLKVSGGALKRVDGHWLWATTIPANSSRTLTFRYRSN